MLSAAQQRGRLRQVVLRELRSANLKGIFRQMLRDNNQDVSGFLQRSVSSSRFESSLRVSSDLGIEDGLITNVRLEIEAPWGRYGRQLDIEGSYNDPVTDPPTTETIMQWITQKGLSVTYRTTKELKNGSNKTYTYTNTLSAKKAVAYLIAKKIASEGKVSTTYNYADDLAFEFELIAQAAIEDWFEEMALEFTGSVEVEISNLI